MPMMSVAPSTTWALQRIRNDTPSVELLRGESGMSREGGNIPSPVG